MVVQYYSNLPHIYDFYNGALSLSIAYFEHMGNITGWTSKEKLRHSKSFHRYIFHDICEIYTELKSDAYSFGNSSAMTVADVDGKIMMQEFIQLNPRQFDWEVIACHSLVLLSETKHHGCQYIPTSMRHAAKTVATIQAKQAALKISSEISYPIPGLGE
jgi:hypothetical protein